MHIIAIDPGLVTSGTGVALFQDGRLKKTLYIAPVKPYDFHEAAVRVIDTICENIDADVVRSKNTKFIVETNRYLGKANMIHLKLLGALDLRFTIETIHAMTTKKLVTGNGRATKEDIKRYLWERYPDFRREIQWKYEDVVDAVAVGIAYLRRRKVNEKET